MKLIGKKNRAKVKGINIVKKHVKTTKEKEGWNNIKRKFYSHFKFKKNGNY